MKSELISKDYIRSVDVGDVSLKVTNIISGSQKVGSAALADRATKADAWTSARGFTLTGGVTGSTTSDGSGNISITTTVGNDSHTHDTRYYTEAEIEAKLATKISTSTAATSSVRGGLKVSVSGTTLTISN